MGSVQPVFAHLFPEGVLQVTVAGFSAFYTSAYLACDAAGNSACLVAIASRYGLTRLNPARFERSSA